MDPVPFGELIRPVIESRQFDGPLAVASRVRTSLLELCPELESDWCLPLVIDAVVGERLPEQELNECLMRIRKRLANPDDYPGGPVRSAKSYIAVSLRDALARHGIAWKRNRNPQSLTQRKIG